MNKLSVLILLVTLCLCSCQSKEDKAQKMAAEYLKGTLFHYDSYQPLKTTVDSSYTSLFTDTEAIQLTLDMGKMFMAMKEYYDNIESAERTMSIYAPSSYSSAYDTRKYKQAKDDKDKNEKRMDKMGERILSQFEKIKIRQSQINKGKFNGWVVYHKFKSLNGARTIDMTGEYVFLCDKNFNEKFAFSKDEFEELSRFMTAIAQSEDMLEFKEKLDELQY